MNLRQRFLDAVEGREVFPVPTDVMENYFYPNVEGRLMEMLGVSDRQALLRELNAHARWANPKYIGPPFEKAPVQPESSFPAKYAYKNIWGSYSGLNAYSDDLVLRPLAEASSVADVERHRWPDTSVFDFNQVAPPLSESEDYIPLSQWAKKNGAYARMLGGYEPIFGRLCDLIGIEKTMMNMVLHPDMFRAAVEHITDFLENYYEGMAQAGEGLIDVLIFGDDFASQNGMMFNPRQWREFFTDSWKRLFAVAHRHGMKAMFHSCGGVRPVIGDLIDCGMDIFQVVQLKARDMDPLELKSEFGSDLTFYGTVDVQDVLPHYSPEEVREEVRRLIDIFGKGGRYILTSSHIVTEDIPAANIIAMFEEAALHNPNSIS